MFKSNSHDHEKIILKALENLFTDEYFTVTAVTHVYIILMFTLAHHFHECQN